MSKGSIQEQSVSFAASLTPDELRFTAALLFLVSLVISFWFVEYLIEGDFTDAFIYFVLSAAGMLLSIRNTVISYRREDANPYS